MNHLRNSLMSIVPFIVLSCSTPSSYEVKLRPGTEVLEVVTTPNRLLPYCEKLGEDSYGFMVLILDDAKTVVSAAGSMTSQRGCENWEKTVRKIINNGKNIKLIGTGDLEEPRVKGNHSYTFSEFGTFYRNGRVLHLAAITNEHGDCFGMYSRKCSGGDFPLAE